MLSGHPWDAPSRFGAHCTHERHQLHTSAAMATPQLPAATSLSLKPPVFEEAIMRQCCAQISWEIKQFARLVRAPHALRPKNCVPEECPMFASVAMASSFWSISIVSAHHRMADACFVAGHCLCGKESAIQRKVAVSRGDALRPMPAMSSAHRPALR
jgi:hypothetical protein